MPPKKTTSRASRAKASRSLKSQMHSLPTSSNHYRIYIYNFFSPQLKKIENEFVKQLKVERRRSHVTGVSMDKIISNFEIKREFRESVQGNLYEIHDEEMYQKVLSKTKESLNRAREHIEEVLAVEAKRYSFDFAQYWERLALEAPKKSPKSTKTSPIKTKKSPTKATKTVEKTICTLDKPEIIILASKDSSVIRKVLFDKDKHFIVDHPEDGVDEYILLIGQFSNRFILDLIRAHYPIGGLTFLIPKTFKYQFQVGYIPQLSQFEELLVSPETKNISIDVQFIPIFSPCQAEYHKKEIDKELTYHMYDLEIIRIRNYKEFLSKYHENYVEMKGDCSGPEKSNDDPTFCDAKEVVKFYNDILNILEPFNESSSTLLSNSSVYFIDNDFEIKVFGRQNKILRNEVTMDRLSESFTYLYKLLRSKVINLIDSVDYYNYNIYFKNPMEETKLFLEPLMHFGLCQRFLELQGMCSFYRKYNFENWTVIVFESKRHFAERQSKYELITKVCFRDFVNYIFPKHPVLTKIENLLHEEELEINKNTEKKKFMKKFATHDFVRLRSFKYSQAFGFLNKRFTSMNIHEWKVARSMSNVNLNTDPLPIEGYNLGDTYVEVSTDERVFR